MQLLWYILLTMKSKGLTQSLSEVVRAFHAQMVYKKDTTKNEIVIKI